MTETTKQRVRRPDSRPNEIMQACLELSMQPNQSYRTITRDQIADRAGCAPGTVSRHFGAMENLRTHIMLAAIEREIPQIVLQGLVTSDLVALRAPQTLKEKANAILLTE